LDRRPVTASTREAERQVRLLDLGCGTGRLLWHLQQTEFSGKLCGCDVSAGMLAELRRTWVAGVLPEVRLLDRETVLPFGDGEFDVVVLSAVVHHVLPAQRPKLLQETWRVLAPGGRAVIFEHNIYHPLTRWVVARTAIDRHAVLVSPRALCAALRAAGFSDVMTRYLLFLPPRWRWTLLVDDWLGWLPAGGQYVVTGDKA
jgi:SAM-dependent methyltransferase